MKEMLKPFLTARWENLLNITYKVPDKLLEEYLPPGLDFDRLEGSALLSLVAFDFLDTKAWGVPWPGFRNFPELNLRFYVKNESHRGVCFIREFVPSQILAWIARAKYNEPYLGVPYVKAALNSHVLKYGGREHRISWSASEELWMPSEESAEHFLKEHEWGFGQDSKGRLLRYQVKHPQWKIYKDVQIDLKIDFGRLYGEKWSFLNAEEPFSILNALGSEVEVYHSDIASR